MHESHRKWIQIFENPEIVPENREALCSTAPPFKFLRFNSNKGVHIFKVYFIKTSVISDMSFVELKFIYSINR